MEIELIQRYDATTIWLHWITALLVTALWVIGQIADLFPHGPVNTGLWSVHVTMGFILVFVILTRVVWRSTHGRRLPAVYHRHIHSLSKSMHLMLYFMMLVVTVLGLANAFVRGYSLFGLMNLPKFGEPALRRPITQWHGLAANVLMGLAVVHTAAALVHHYFFKDRLLYRMRSQSRPLARRIGTKVKP